MNMYKILAELKNIVQTSILMIVVIFLGCGPFEQLVDFFLRSIGQ